MNIIGNNCVSSRLYRINNIQFNNPFIWASTYYPDFVKLIKNWDSIDFHNITIQYDECPRTNNMSPLVICDNLVKVHFIHYIQDDSCDKPIHRQSKANVDLFYNDIMNYTTTKWHERVDRMNELPTFLYCFNYRYKTLDEMVNASNEEISQYRNMVKTLYECSEKHKIYVLMHENVIYEEFFNKQTENFKIITADVEKMAEDKMPLWDIVNKNICI